jgi:DNA-binding transcriptional LysR family regulator
MQRRGDEQGGSDVDFKLVETFLCVFEEGNVTRAAAKLNVVQPAVSNQIKKLEATLKLELFARTPRGISPTPSGRALYRLFAPVLESFRAAEYQAHALSHTQIHEMSVGLNPFASDALTGDVLQAFRIRFPEVEVHVEEELSDTLLRRVADGALDLAIVHFGTQSVGIPAIIAAIPLADEELVFVERDAGPGSSEPLRLVELANRPLVLPRSRLGFRRDLEHAASQNQISIVPALEINAPGPLLDVVANGELTAVVPEITARRAAEHLPLRIRRIVQPAVIRNILCVHRRDRPLSPILGEFAAIVKTKVENQLAQPLPVQRVHIGAGFNTSTPNEWLLDAGCDPHRPGQITESQGKTGDS